MTSTHHARLSSTDAAQPTQAACTTSVGLHAPLSTENADTLEWVKASRSWGKGECVELADAGDHIALRDSKNPHLGHLTFTRQEIAAFLDGARRGEFDHLA